MRIHYLIFVLVSLSFLAPHALAAQQAPVNDSLEFVYYPYLSSKKQLWGYADKNGKVLIKPAYNDIKCFYQGMAPVKGSTGWGIIDQKRKWIIPPQYDDIETHWDFDFFVLIKDKKRDIRYIVDGKLVNENEPPSYVQDVQFTEELVEPADKKNTKPGIRFITRRQYDSLDKHYKLTRWMIMTDGQEKPVVTKSFPFYYFTEGKNRGLDWMFSIYPSPDSTHVGMLAWRQNDWNNQLLDAVYDSIRWPNYNNPFFVGKKQGKYAFITFSLQDQTFYETPAQFDAISECNILWLPVRIGAEWFLLKRFGEFDKRPDKNSIKLNIELIGADMDTITRYENTGFFVYKRKQLYGLIRSDDIANEKSTYLVIPARYTQINRKEWFLLDQGRSPYKLWEVTRPDGKKGPMTSKGVELFK